MKNHFYPDTVEETIELLKEPNSRLLAGGTALSLSSSSTLETLIDLQNLNLSYIKDDGEFYTIGAMTSLYDIYSYENFPESLIKAADCVGDLPLLHAVTVGGNLAMMYPWVDLPPMLWALGASITIYRPEEAVLSSNDFFEYAQERNIGKRGDLITEIGVPKPPTNSFSEFQSLTLLNNEKSQLNLASYFEWDENQKITTVRLIVSSVTRNLTRLPIENQIRDNMLTDELIKECVESVVTDIKIVPNYKSSKEYRGEILRVFTKRTLNNCRQEMKGVKQ